MAEKNRKKIILTVVGGIIIALLLVISYYWINNALYITTEDSKVTGDLVKISPQSTGKIADILIDEGSIVMKNEITARLDLLNQSDANVELSMIRSPINGIIVKKQDTIGEILSAGQVLAYVIDPAKLYIVANIEETKINKVKIGQKVEIKIDQFSGKKFIGHVSRIGKVSTSAFSLLPSSSGTAYTKVVQKIPVNIDFDKHEEVFTSGTNTIIKIIL